MQRKEVGGGGGGGRDIAGWLLHVPATDLLRQLYLLSH